MNVSRNSNVNERTIESKPFVPALEITAGQPKPIAANGGWSYMVKDYDGDNTAVLTFNISATEVRFTVNDTTNFTVGDRIVIDSEVMQIKEKPDATTLVVKRGFDRTLKVEHLEQARVNKLTTADDNLIDIGDDFGFSETSSIFTDSLQFNPATRTDS